eukprot:SAG31_NODE_3241_length_4506_cov_1.758112_3_plen_721_part_00
MTVCYMLGRRLLARPTSENQCACAHGTPATGAACLADGAEICNSCDAGYTAVDNLCRAHACTCAHGTPATGAACLGDGAEICTSCHAGYMAAGTVCGRPSSPHRQLQDSAEGPAAVDSAANQSTWAGTCKILTFPGWTSEVSLSLVNLSLVEMKIGWPHSPDTPATAPVARVGSGIQTQDDSGPGAVYGRNQAGTDAMVGPCYRNNCNGAGICEAGVCQCKDGFIDELCTVCDESRNLIRWTADHVSFECIYDWCGALGSVDVCNGHGSCDPVNHCTCHAGFVAAETCPSHLSQPAFVDGRCNCASCAPGLVELERDTYDICVADPCTPDPCNGHGTCTLRALADRYEAVCTCETRFAGAVCNQCAHGGYVRPYPDCRCESGNELGHSEGLVASSFKSYTCYFKDSSSMGYLITETGDTWGPSCKATDGGHAAYCQGAPCRDTGCSGPNASPTACKQACDTSTECTGFLFNEATPWNDGRWCLMYHASGGTPGFSGVTYGGGEKWGTCHWWISNRAGGNEQVHPPHDFYGCVPKHLCSARMAQPLQVMYGNLLGCDGIEIGQTCTTCGGRDGAHTDIRCSDNVPAHSVNIAEVKRRTGFEPSVFDFPKEFRSCRARGKRLGLDECAQYFLNHASSSRVWARLLDGGQMFDGASCPVGWKIISTVEDCQATVHWAETVALKTHDFWVRNYASVYAQSLLTTCTLTRREALCPCPTILDQAA